MRKSWEHKTLEELAALLDAARLQVEVGARYMHYKQMYYTVEDIAILEATNEPAVIYRAEYDKRLVFVRPLSAWLETVEWQGKMVPRFIKVEDKL